MRVRYLIMGHSYILGLIPQQTWGRVVMMVERHNIADLPYLLSKITLESLWISTEDLEETRNKQNILDFIFSEQFQQNFQCNLFSLGFYFAYNPGCHHP